MLGILLTIPVGLVFAVPALRTRGVNLAVVTLGLGFLVSEVVFANPNYLGGRLDGGTRIGRVKLFGMQVDAFNHPHAWAAVSLVCFVLLALLVANLRRSRTGRRLIAVRTNERAAASLGISVFGVKLYAFAVASGLAAVAGILVGFKGQVVTYTEFNIFAWTGYHLRPTKLIPSTPKPELETCLYGYLPNAFLEKVTALADEYRRTHRPKP